MRDAGDAREVLDARRLHALEPAEMREQRLPPLGADAEAKRAVQVGVDPPGERMRDGAAAREGLVARRLHGLEPAEMREQRLAPLGVGAAGLLQRRRVARLRAPRTMALDREAVGL